METLGERIKLVRKDNHLTQYEFGKKLGVTQTHISKIEKNSENPSETLLRFISYLYCVNFEWLMNGTGERELSANSSDEYETVRLEKARLTLENNLKYWGNDVSWEYVNTIVELSSILSRYIPDPDLELNCDALIEYYKSIASIINHILIMTLADEQIKEGMNKEGVYKILLNHFNLINLIEDDLKDLTKSIFKIHNINISQYAHHEEK